MQEKATGDERDGSFGTVRARLLRRVTNLSRRGTSVRPIWFPGLPYRDYDPRSFWNYLNHATLRRSAPRCPGRVGWLRRRPRAGSRVTECGKPVPTLVEPRTFEEQCVLKEEHSNQTSGKGAGI